MNTFTNKPSEDGTGVPLINEIKRRTIHTTVVHKETPNPIYRTPEMVFNFELSIGFIKTPNNFGLIYNGKY